NVDPDQEKSMHDDLASKVAPGTVQGLKHSVKLEPSKSVKLRIDDFDTSKLSAQDKSGLSASIARFNAKGYKADMRGGMIVNMQQLKTLGLKDLSVGNKSGL